MDKRSLYGQTVLLADDDPVQLSLTGLALRHLGAKVYVAHSGGEVLRWMIAGVQPSAILCDVRLPGVDGHRLLRWMRSWPYIADIPVIALADESQSRQRGSLRRAGFADVLVKPVDLNTLCAAVRHYILNMEPQINVYSLPENPTVTGSFETKIFCISYEFVGYRLYPIQPEPKQNSRYGRISCHYWRDPPDNDGGSTGS
jgi:CheY-like chemotaxis protein